MKLCSAIHISSDNSHLSWDVAVSQESATPECERSDHWLAQVVPNIREGRSWVVQRFGRLDLVWGNHIFQTVISGPQSGDLSHLTRAIFVI